MTKRTLAIVVASVVAMPLALAQPAFAPEPAGLWPGPMHGATPATLAGATVIDSHELADLVAKRKPLLFDVANKTHEPAVRPKDMPWDPIHRSIPGAIWLPGAGTGKHDARFEAAFAARMAAATGGDKTKPIITFCHPQRWGSWNMAKRLTELGYTNVYWYPGGAEGWADQGKLTIAPEDPTWKATGYDWDTAGEMPPAAANR